MPSVVRKQSAAEREVRRNTIAAHVLSGWTYRDIATALSISLGTVAADMQLVMERWRTEQIQQVNERRQLDVRRLDRALQAIWGKVEAGDVYVIDRMIKLIQERAKLLGMYAPE